MKVEAPYEKEQGKWLAQNVRFPNKNRTQVRTELNKLGLMSDPDNPTKAVPLAAKPDEIPDESWSLDELAVYISGEFGQATVLSRKSAVAVFRAGRALCIARKKVKELGIKWTVWLAEQNIPRTNDFEARGLFTGAKAEKALHGLTLTDAKKKFCSSEKAADWDQTPGEICKKIIGLVPWTEGELVLEPFRGDGNFYNNLPGTVRKDWCEIRQGRDFFHYDGQPETIITNPPFRDKAGGDDLVIPSLERCLQLARNRVIFFVNHKSFNSLTAGRLKRYGEWGWAVTHLSVWDTSKWFGRYYLTIWEKDKSSIIGYFTSGEQTGEGENGGAAGEAEACRTESSGVAFTTFDANV